MNKRTRTVENITTVLFLGWVFALIVGIHVFTIQQGWYIPLALIDSVVFAVCLNIWDDHLSDKERIEAHKMAWDKERKWNEDRPHTELKKDEEKP